MLESEILRTVCNQQHVRTLLHDQARQVDGILDVAYRGDGPGARAAAVHDGGIELRIAVVVEYRATAGVELRVILHGAHRRGHRIERAAAAIEYLVAGSRAPPRARRGRRPP